MKTGNYRNWISYIYRLKDPVVREPSLPSSRLEIYRLSVTSFQPPLTIISASSYKTPTNLKYTEDDWSTTHPSQP